METEKIEGYYREKVIAYYSQREKKRNYQFTNLNTMSRRLGWCEYDEQRTKSREKVKWECEEVSESGELEGWDSAWTMSILQRYQYGGNTPWCTQWAGKTNDSQRDREYMADQRETSSRE